MGVGVRVATGRAQPEPWLRQRRPATGCLSNLVLSIKQTLLGLTCRRTVPHTRSATPGKTRSPAFYSLRVGNPARRDAYAQGTLNPGMRAGVRCGPSAPLRVATGRAQPEPKHRFGRWRRPATGCGAGCRTTHAVDQNNPAWRAGPPYRIPALGAGTKELFRTTVNLKKYNKNRGLKILSMRVSPRLDSNWVESDPSTTFVHNGPPHRGEHRRHAIAAQDHHKSHRYARGPLTRTS